MTVRITSYGARVVQLLAPDRNGNLGDVVMGFDTIEQPNKYVPSAGAIIGRYANRIAQGKITIDGTPYQLTINNGPNHLHGGTKGTRFVVFDAKPIDDHSIQFNYFFKAGEEGYPGDCALKVIYALTDDNALRITYDAVTDAPTVVNFPNHTNFNLTGRPGTNINDHVVTINANRFTPIGDNLIPNGEFRSLKGTPFDFTQPTCQSARKRDPSLECAPAGGQIGRFELTPFAGLPEDGSHDKAPVPQCGVQAPSC